MAFLPAAVASSFAHVHDSTPPPLDEAVATTFATHAYVVMLSALVLAVVLTGYWVRHVRTGRQELVNATLDVRVTVQARAAADPPAQAAISPAAPTMLDDTNPERATGWTLPAGVHWLIRQYLFLH